MPQHADSTTKNTTPQSTLYVTPAASAYLEQLAAQLEVPPSRYEEAINRYQSVAAWLDRDDSTLAGYSPNVYVQGSFRLGTPVRPMSETEDYDIDLVCELDVQKSSVTQQELKALLGREINLYAEAHGMAPPQESRRCWTLDYAEGAHFHLDALPAVPDASTKRMLLEARALSSEWADSAIAITDTDHPAYRQVHRDWPHSNPRGYTEWFRSRMRAAFEARRQAMALEARASVEDVPAYKVKTPLQQAVQLLKRHRDNMFVDDPDVKPISVILTTLAGLAYRGESTVALAINAILRGMDAHIRYDGSGHVIIANPTDPMENFADKWVMHPERQQAFIRWLDAARRDFGHLARQAGMAQLVEAATTVAGERHARAAAGAGKRPVTLATLMPRFFATGAAPHREPPRWPIVEQGTAIIKDASWTANGFSRPKRFGNDSAPLRKHCQLVFKASTNVPAPFQVYWQVVNTGSEATAAGALRGGFDVGRVERGHIIRKESTLYTGPHSIQCFIVKNGFLAARSGVFVVNVK